MPGSALLLAGIAILAAVAGLLLGWMLRGERLRRERLSIAATWQEKLESAELVAERLRKHSRSVGGRLDDSRRAEREARRRLAGLEQELAELVQSRERAETELVDSQIALASSNRKRDELHRQLQNLILRTRELVASGQAKDEKIFTLSRELESWRLRLPPLVDRFREKQKEATAVNEALDMERARARELEDTLKTRILPLVAAGDGNGGGRAGETDPLLEECEAECRRLERELADARSTIDDLRQERRRAAHSPDGGLTGHDDLQRIKGVGPALERLLNGMGIYRLEQIARFSDEDVERVQAELKEFPGRIRRDDWVGQARAMTRDHRRSAGQSVSETRSER